MDQRTIDKIKQMSKYMTEQGVAETLNIPEDLVSSVLRGDVESTAQPVPNSPTYKVQVVEKARYVRNKTITAISPGGGKGKTTLLSALAMTAAANSYNRRPVAIMDLAEIPKVTASMGIRLMEHMNNPDFIFPSIEYWDDQFIDSRSLTQHPMIENLWMLPGVVAAKNHRNIKQEKMVEIINHLQRRYEVVFIDLPANPILAESFFPCVDCIILALTPDYGSLEGLTQLLPTLVENEVLSKCYIVFNRVGHPGLYDIYECRKRVNELLRQNTFLLEGNEIKVIGFLPESPDILKCINDATGNLLADQNYLKELNHILSQLLPDWKINAGKDNKGGAFSRLLGSLKGR